MPETFEAEALFLFPTGCTCKNNEDSCDFCMVKFEGECPECNHHVRKHRDRSGCQEEYTISNPMFEDHYDMDVPCGCERLAMFYKPISTHWKVEAK